VTGRKRLAGALVTAALAPVLAIVLGGCGGLAAGPGVPAGNDWTTVAPPKVFINGILADQVSESGASLRDSLGVQVYWNQIGPKKKMENQATRIFNYIVGLGANATAIDFPFYTNGEYPTHVYGMPGKTPSPALIALVVADARKHGLRVLVRPVLNDDNIKVVKDAWRGSIRPKSLSAWFGSYYDFLKPYLSAARKSQAGSFNIDTELDSLAPDKSYWARLQAKARKLFPGGLGYAVNYGLWEQDLLSTPVPNVAVDAYPQLGMKDNATVAELTAAWVSWLRGYRTQAVLKKTVLQEVGIAAVTGAYSAPAITPPDGTPLVLSIQRKWFAAACAAAKQTHVPGLYFFDVNSTDKPSGHAATSHYAPGSFVGRSDDTIKACFASGWT
jgi:hypothetical protein